MTVIKCDVEGAELPVLKGADQTLRGGRPTLLLEVENRWTSRFDYSPGELFDWLSGLGYRRQMVLPHGLEPNFTRTTWNGRTASGSTRHLPTSPVTEWMILPLARIRRWQAHSVQLRRGWVNLSPS